MSDAQRAQNAPLAGSMRLLDAAAHRVDSLLTPSRLRVYPFMILALFLPVLLLTWVGTIPGQGLLPDYVARWTAGRMVLSRETAFYDPGTQYALQRQALGSVSFSWFVSPPFAALLFVPLAVLPYTPSAILWLMVSIGALAWSFRLIRPLAESRLGARWPAFVLLVWSAFPVLELLGSGQDTALVLLCFVAATRLMISRRDFAAGAVLALGLIKPQLLFLVPFLLIVQNRYRSLAGFASVATGLACVSVLLVGWDGVRAFIGVPWHPLYRDAVQHGQAWKGVSLQAWLTAVAPPSELVVWHVVSVLVGLGAAGVGLVLAARASDDPLATMAGLLAATVVGSPHVMVYDLVIALPMLAFAVNRCWTPRMRAALATIYVLLWLTGLAHSAAQVLPWPASILGAPWAALAWLAISLLLLVCLRHGGATRSVCR